MNTPKITFESYKSRGATRIRVRHQNGNIIFNAGQGYSRQIDALTMLKNFIKAVKDGEYDHLPQLVEKDDVPDLSDGFPGSQE